MAVKIYGSNRIDLDGNNETFSIRATADDELNFYKGASTKLMGMDASGFESKPNIPAFMAYGNAGAVSVDAGQEFPISATSTNIGNHYNISTYRFTAPVAGFYSFQYGLYSYEGPQQVAIKKNGLDWRPSDTTGLFSVESNRLNSGAISMSLEVGDYVSFGFRDGYSGNVYMSHTWLSGFLVG